MEAAAWPGLAVTLASDTVEPSSNRTSMVGDDALGRVGEACCETRRGSCRVIPW